MGKKGKRAQAGKPQKLTPKEVGKRLDALVKKLEEELKRGRHVRAPPTNGRLRNLLCSALACDRKLAFFIMLR